MKTTQTKKTKTLYRHSGLGRDAKAARREGLMVRKEDPGSLLACVHWSQGQEAMVVRVCVIGSGMESSTGVTEAAGSHEVSC